MGIIERIKQFAEYKEVSMRRFCEIAGIANGGFTKVKSVGSENLLKIFNAFPDVNLTWLITGKGEMLDNNAQTADNKFAMELIEKKDERIEELIRENERKEQELAELKKRFTTSTVSTSIPITESTQTQIRK